MNAQSEKARLARWWTVSLLLVAVVEAAVCALLFIPQSRAMEGIRKQKHYVERQLGELRQAPDSFHKVMAQVNETGELLARLNVVTERPAQDMVMDAVAAASAPEGVTVVGLAPEEEIDREKPQGRSDKAKSKEERAAKDKTQVPRPAWRLRCRGSFRDLTLFLNSLETQGLLLEAGDFRLDATDRDGGIEAEVVLKTWRSSPAPIEARERKAEGK